MGATFEIYEDDGGEYRFRLKAANGEIVAQGESYPTAAAAREAIDAVRTAAAEADPDQGMLHTR